MSRYLSQMIKAEWKEREFSESFIVAQRPTNTLHTHKRIRDAPRGSFFQDFTPLCFCFTLQPWNGNSVNMTKSCAPAYWHPSTYISSTSHTGLMLLFVFVFSCQVVFEKLRFMGTDRIGFSLIYSCANIYQSRTVCYVDEGDWAVSFGWFWWNLKCVSESTPSVFTVIWSSISYRDIRVWVFSLSRPLIPGERNFTPTVPGERKQSRREFNHIQHLYINSETHTHTSRVVPNSGVENT